MSLLTKELRLVDWLGALAIATAIVGCGRRDQITRYTVTKPEIVDPTLVAGPPASPSVPQEILGAILIADDTKWFFKLMGDPQTVQSQHETFLQFVKSVKWAAPDSPPTWNLPK